ncbi:MAG: FecR domain-containing protein [Alphaproteobacteria bacterium]|nr:FecR domain-containing protein [Alphaproteobacteria bacterium]
MKNTLAGAAALALLAAGLGSPAMAATQTEIGVTSLVVKDVEGKTDAEIRQLALRDNVYRYETVNTGFESASELRFADDTRISVGPNSTIVLDEFVYDPDPGEGALVLQMTEGVFRFFSGNMASSNYKIKASNVTVGVRGTVLVMVARRDGTVAVIMESDDGVEVTGGAGEMVLLDKPGKATVAFADGTLSPPGNPPEWAMSRIRQMDNLLTTASLPPPPPMNSEPEVETAVAPPPPAEPLEAAAAPKRGLPRASDAIGEEGMPAGGYEHANEKALLPDPPRGNDSAEEGEEDGEEQLLIADGDDSSDGGKKGNRGGNRDHAEGAGGDRDGGDRGGKGKGDR